MEHRRSLERARYAKKREKVLAKRAFAVLTEQRREVLRQRRRDYYSRNREASLVAAKVYRDRTVEKRAAYARVRAKLRPEVYRAAANRRRAMLAKAEGDFTPEQFKALCELYGNVCACCRQAKKLEADHIVPLTKGGDNTIDNIQPLCKSCNSSKGTRTVHFMAPEARYWIG